MRFEMKAGLGFASVLLLLACGMAISIERLGSLSNEQVATLRAEEQEITIVERLRWNGELIVSNGRGYLLSADAPLLERIRAAAGRFDDNVRALRTASLSAEGRALVQDVEAAAAAFRQVQEALLAARAVSAQPGPLVERFEAELLPLRAELDQALDRLVDFKELALRASYDHARARRDRTAVQLYALVGLLVLVGVALATYFSNLLGRAYRQERAAHETASRAVAARDELMGVIAHDLRNPLGSVMMRAEVLQTVEDPEKVRRHATGIANVAKRMEHLIKSMLDVATLEAGRFTVTPEPTDVPALVRDATEIFVPQAAAKDIALERHLDDDLCVAADRERVIQVLSNLVGNALKFTPTAGVIAVDVHREADRAHFTVSDTGPGIPEEDVAHLFDRFWKRESGGRKGTGLGLFIAKGIVDAHAGRIWVESTPGQGSAFHFTLPLADAQTIVR